MAFSYKPLYEKPSNSWIPYSKWNSRVIFHVTCAWSSDCFVLIATGHNCWWRAAIWKHWKSLTINFEFVVLQFSPAVLATVVLCDPVFVFSPNVHSWENQRHQYGKAAHQGKDHNALLLRLQEREGEQHWFPRCDFYSSTPLWKQGQSAPTLALISWLPWLI